MAVLKYSMNNSVTPFSVVLAAFSILLQKFTREERIAIGSSTSACAPLILRVDIEVTITAKSLLITWSYFVVVGLTAPVM